jgi:hypothetical protein
MRARGGLGARGGQGGQRPDRAGRTGRRPPVPGRSGDPPHPAFARATAVAAVGVVVAGTLGTLWLRGWGRVGFEVPSVPWYFSFPFYVFPDPRLDLGWAAAALPLVAATVGAVLALDHARIAWGWRVAASAGLARDELGERGGRLALTVWVVAPGVVLYLATSADAVFAAVLGAAALAAHRGLTRRSPCWTVAGGILLWASSMLTYAAALLLVFLGARAAGRLRADRGWVLRWAALTGAVVASLAGGLWLAAGYDVPAAVLAVHGAYRAAPGSAGRSLVHWLPGDLLAFGGMLGVPLLAALAARTVAVVRERAWASVDAAALATLLAAASWGFTKGEVERIFQFLVPLVLVPVVRQLLAWRVRAPLVVGLLVGQTLLVQVLSATRW